MVIKKFSIDIKYRKTDVTPSYIVVVAAASLRRICWSVRSLVPVGRRVARNSRMRSFRVRFAGQFGVGISAISGSASAMGALNMSFGVCARGDAVMKPSLTSE